jgi:hypothetical protein
MAAPTQVLVKVPVQSMRNSAKRRVLEWTETSVTDSFPWGTPRSNTEPRRGAIECSIPFTA